MSQFFREGNSIDGVGMRKLRDDSSSVSLSQTTATIVREIVGHITVIRNETVLDKNTWNSLLASAADNGELVAYLHLKYAAVC